MSVTLAKVNLAGMDSFVIGDEVSSALNRMLDAAIEAVPAADQPHVREHRDALYHELVTEVHRCGHLPESVSLVRKAPDPTPPAAPGAAAAVA